MSRDINYIGMDVHKEAIVIAVLNGSGKLVMETILETKASSILQFIHGLRKVSFSAEHPDRSRVPGCGTKFRRHLRSGRPTPRLSFDGATVGRERRRVPLGGEVAKSRSQRFPESSAPPKRVVPDSSARP